MRRDFTYVEDLVAGIRLLVDVVPGAGAAVEGDSLSPVAPWRVVNIGSGAPVPLMEFIRAIEQATGRRAQLNMMCRCRPEMCPSPGRMVRSCSG